MHDASPVSGDLEAGLIKALATGADLGPLDSNRVHARWREICAGVPAARIACDLPVLLGRLYRTERGAEALQACGLLPRAGRRDLYWQALAVRVAALADGPGSTRSDQSTSTDRQRDEESLAELHDELMKLMDAARAWEEERRILSETNTRLEAALNALKADTARAVDSILDNRPDAIRGLARLAETSGLSSEASSLRRLPRLPFTPLATPPSPRRGPGIGTDALSLYPSHQMETPRDRAFNTPPH